MTWFKKTVVDQIDEQLNQTYQELLEAEDRLDYYYQRVDYLETKMARLRGHKKHLTVVKEPTLEE
jgi:hypothetical protein